jgi:hypothetical protein
MRNKKENVNALMQEYFGNKKRPAIVGDLGNLKKEQGNVNLLQQQELFQVQRYNVYM